MLSSPDVLERPNGSYETPFPPAAGAETDYHAVPPNLGRVDPVVPAREVLVSDYRNNVAAPPLSPSRNGGPHGNGMPVQGFRDRWDPHSAIDFAPQKIGRHALTNDGIPQRYRVDMRGFTKYGEGRHRSKSLLDSVLEPVAEDVPIASPPQPVPARRSVIPAENTRQAARKEVPPNRLKSWGRRALVALAMAGGAMSGHGTVPPASTNGTYGNSRDGSLPTAPGTPPPPNRREQGATASGDKRRHPVAAAIAGVAAVAIGAVMVLGLGHDNDNDKGHGGQSGATPTTAPGHNNDRGNDNNHGNGNNAHDGRNDVGKGGTNNPGFTVDSTTLYGNSYRGLFHTEGHTKEGPAFDDRDAGEVYADVLQIEPSGDFITYDQPQPGPDVYLRGPGDYGLRHTGPAHWSSARVADFIAQEIHRVYVKNHPPA